VAILDKAGLNRRKAPVFADTAFAARELFWLQRGGFPDEG